MKITYDDPRLPKGEEVTIYGLNAVLENGKEIEIDPDTIVLFEKKTGKKLSDVVKSSNFSKHVVPEKAKEKE